jgi:hypothetical protein
LGALILAPERTPGISRFFERVLRQAAYLDYAKGKLHQPKRFKVILSHQPKEQNH